MKIHDSGEYPILHTEHVPFGHENYTSKYYHEKKDELGKSTILYFTSTADSFKKIGWVPGTDELLVFTCDDGQSNLLMWI